MDTQKAVIGALGVKPTITPAEEFEHRSQFLASYLTSVGRDGFVLGISGGQDSLLAGLLAQRAIKLLRSQGSTATFHAVLLPYGEQADRADAELVVQTINPDIIHDLSIKPGVDGIASAYASSEGHAMSDYTKGNVKARVRMTVQYAVAGSYNLLVIGTDHAAEAVTGFFTKFGDGGADVLPLSGLSKRQGRAILRELGVPEIFTTKAPTADLLDNVPNQTDESELGISYEVIDDYLEGRLVPEAAAAAIEARYNATQHKRQLPVAYESSTVY